MKTLKVARTAVCAAVVGWAFTAVADIPASAYVQTGLIAQWDGIENAGTGTHQADATTWKDISTAAKGGDLTLAATESFGDNCLTITTAGTHVTGDLGLSSMTLEFVLKRTSGSTGIRRWDKPGSTTTTTFESWSTDTEGILERIGKTRQLTVKPVNGTMYTLATRYTNGGEHRFQAAANGTITKGKTTNSATLIGSYDIPSTIQLLKSTANLEVYAIRIYDHELTDDELMRNAALDRMRFEGVSEDEAGYRYNADESRVETCVSVDMIGADTSRVKVNEGEAGTTAVAWANPGDTVAVSVLPGAGETFVYWKSTDIDLGDAATQPTIEVPLGHPVRLHACLNSATAYDAYSYVQDGLVMQFDGIRNVGAFTDHDSASKTWVDLSPNHYDMTLQANGSFSANSLVSAGPRAALRTGFKFTQYQTVEVLFRPNREGLGQNVFASGGGGAPGNCVINANGILQFNGSQTDKMIQFPTDHANLLIQAAAVHKAADASTVENVYQNGALADNVVTKNGGSWNAKSAFIISGRSTSDYGLYGDIYALRFYNRKLSPGELARNYVIDQKRYGGAELPERRLFSVWGVPANYGVPSPNYGGFVYNDDTEVTCSVADILVTYELDGVRAFRVDDGTRAAFKGYEAGTYSTKETGTDEMVTRTVTLGATYVNWQWQRQYLLHASSASGSCSVTIDGGEAGTSRDKWIDENGTVTVVATAGEGYAFKNWTGVPLDAEAAANPTLTLTMDEAKSVSAIFKETSHVPTDVASTGGDGEWTDGSMWDGGNVPGKGDRVTVTGGTLTLKGETEPLESLVLDGATLVMDEGAQNGIADLKTRLIAGRVELRNGAKITHVVNTMQVDEWEAAGEWRMNGRVHIVCTDLSIDATSSIDVSDKGYAKQTNKNGQPGPGGSLAQRNGNFGGAYGGCGFGEHMTVNVTLRSEDWEHGIPYGDRTAPVWCGSAGGCTTTAAAGRAGGGAVRIEASGRVTVEGAIRADATVKAESNTHGAGSGGGIWIDCATIAGGGIISARGGQGVQKNSAENGSGGGGRIAVHYDATEQDALGTPSLAFDVMAPAVNETYRTTAGVGSLYFTDDRFLGETFDGRAGTGVRNGQVFCGTWGRWRPTKLALDNAWIRLCDPTMPALALSGDVTVTGLEGRLDLGGDETFSCGRFANDPPYMRYGSTRMPSLAAASLVLTDKAQFMAYPAPTNGLDGTRLEVALSGAFSVAKGCLVGTHCHPTNGAVTRITAASANVAGTIDVQGAGFATIFQKALGPGRGTSASRGAGYGGPAASSGELASAGGTYGDLRAPVYPGSSGGPSGNVRHGYSGSAGGGLVWIETTGHFQLDGSITAKGQSNGSGSGTAYGSGGGIYLKAQTFGGTGSLDVSSFACQTAPYQGGGGRLALVYDTAAQAAAETQPAFKMDAMSYGASSQETGPRRTRFGDHDMGTIYLSDARFLPSSFTASTVPGGEIHCGDWSAYRPDSLSVNNAWVRLALDGAAIEVAGDVTVTNRASLGFGGGAHAYSNCMARISQTQGPGPSVHVKGNVVVGDSKPSIYYSIWEPNYWDTAIFLIAGESVVGERDATVGAVLQVDGDFTLATANASCYFFPNAASGAAPVLRARNVRQVEGAIFDAVGTGYSGDATGVKGAGPGGAGPKLAGGGHGGAGASYGGTAGVEYGRARRPYLAGSGGCGNGSNNKTSLAGSGGGVIRIEARNRMELAGVVTADGGQPTANYLGSGAGGSVCLSCDEWAPEETLTISANGGEAYNDYGGGGGGRVAVLRISDLDPRKGDTTVNARGYSTRGYVSVDSLLGTKTPTTSGECGSIYWGAPVGGLLLFVR